MQTSRAGIQQKEDVSSVKPLAQSSKQASNASHQTSRGDIQQKEDVSSVKPHLSGAQSLRAAPSWGMNPKEASAQLGSSSSSSSQDSKGFDIQTSTGDIQQNEDMSSAKPLADSSEQPSNASQEPDTKDAIYKIVFADRWAYALTGYVYFRYLIPPEKRSTGWFCIVAFHWQDVQAEFECVYHPSIMLFDDFKPIEGSFKGGSRKIQRLELSMWHFRDRGPDLNPKHAVNDDNGNRIMLATMITDDGSAVKLFGKRLREGDKQDEVSLSRAEFTRVGLR